MKLKVALFLSIFLLTPAGAAAAGQQPKCPNGVKKSPSVTERNLYAPRVTGYAESFVIEGRLISRRRDHVVLGTPEGERLRFRVDEETTVFEGGEAVSIATLDEVTISVANLKALDLIEIVAEREANGLAARIITRVAGSDHVARR